MAAPNVLAGVALQEAHAPAWDSLFALSPGLMVWTVVTFLALLAITTLLGWKPMLSALDARSKGIQDSLDQAKRDREAARASLQEYNAQLSQGRRRVQELIAEGRQAAENLRKELEEKARLESRALLERAREEIRRERDQALESVRKESVRLALAAASKLIGARLDAEADRQLVRRRIDQMALASDGGDGGAVLGADGGDDARA